MYGKLGTVVAILMGAFPFVALGYTMAGNSTTSIIVYAAIVLILLAGVLIGPRLKLAQADIEVGESAARQPAPPIEWSWDGVNRQPGEEKE